MITASTIVRKVNPIVKCDIYTCNEMAEYEIGHELSGHMNLHICKSCMDAIATEYLNLEKSKAEETEKLPFEEDAPEVTETKAEEPAEEPKEKAPAKKTKSTRTKTGK